MLTSSLRSRAFALGAIGACLFVGCGGGGSEALSHQQLVAKANAACAQANELQRRASKPEDLPGVATYFAELEPIIVNLEAKLSQLQPPAQDASSFNEFLTFLHTETEKLGEARKAAEAEDSEQVQEIFSEFEGSLGSKMRVALSNLGLTECEAEVEPEG